MNKGLILEIKETEVIVLTEDGSFITVKKSLAQGLDIGEEILFPRSTGVFQHLLSKKWLIPALTAACILLIISAIIGNPFIFKEEPILAYVHVDINPSLELEVNKQLEVVNLTGLNKAGEALLLTYEIKPGQKLDNVTIQLLELAAAQGYFNEHKDVLISTTIAREEEREEYARAIELALDQVDTYLHQGAILNVAQGAITDQSKYSAQGNQIKQQTMMEIDSENMTEPSVESRKHGNNRHITIHRLQADKEVSKEAKESGMSPGKYSLYLQAKEKGIIIELEDIKEKSVSELAKELGGLGSNRSNKQGEKGEQRPPGLEKKKGKVEGKQDRVVNQGKLSPSQEKKKEEGKLPPGQEKKKEEGRLPPGQAKKQGEGKLPRGQEKQQGEGKLPPGQAKKKGGKSEQQKDNSKRKKDDTR